MRIEMHCHEMLHSKCSRISFDDLAVSADYSGVDAIYITDHDSMNFLDNINSIQHNYSIKFFVGIEASTMNGDIIAIGPYINFNTYMIETQEFINYINENNGFCYAVHPFRGSGFGYYTYNLENLHSIEIVNGRCSDTQNRKALQLCDELGLIPMAGSDAHTIEDIGKCPMWIPDHISSSQELAVALKSGLSKIINK